MLLWSRVRKPSGHGPAVLFWEMQANTDHAPHSQPHSSTAQESSAALTEAPWESYKATPVCWAQDNKPCLSVKLISPGLATGKLQWLCCQSRACASPTSSKGGQSVLLSAGKIPSWHMLRHHVSWHWANPHWRAGYYVQSHSWPREFSGIMWAIL